MIWLGERETQHQLLIIKRDDKFFDDEMKQKLLQSRNAEGIGKFKERSDDGIAGFWWSTQYVCVNSNFNFLTFD